MSARNPALDAPAHKKPVLGKCCACGHVWPLVWIPMEMSRAARAMKAGSTICPACGTDESNKLVLATEFEAVTWSTRHPNMSNEVS